MTAQQLQGAETCARILFLLAVVVLVGCFAAWLIHTVGERRRAVRRADDVAQARRREVPARLLVDGVDLTSLPGVTVRGFDPYDHSDLNVHAAQGCRGCQDKAEALRIVRAYADLRDAERAWSLPTYRGADR